ncbi:MAG: transcription-repair coupling factor [Candidatus Nitrohelix vancouverensis]|uniref:Transcription-repair-coupling factor n=1 Tax=Candidatus Nitrohelix vancouverensis TaxID=2705534 RepID=A0A7T0C3V9_9BACT|nr:MAG: transcription-repair coupling factor [Candidatus Nitrohelix vancouverensis]
MNLASVGKQTDRAQDSALEPLWNWLKSDAASPLRIEGVSGSSKAFLLAHIKKNHSGPVLVVTPGSSAGEMLYGDLKYFERVINPKIGPQFFPAWEMLPYEDLSPLIETTGERLSVLTQCLTREDFFLVAPIESLFQALIPRKTLTSQIFPIRKGDVMEREILEACLADNGYHRVPMVEAKGDFSVRGDIVDFFMPSENAPVRLELFGDEVETLRYFDVVSQVSMESIEQIAILPTREICPSTEQSQAAVEKLIADGKAMDAERRRVKEVADQIEQFGLFPGMERYLPYYYQAKESLLDYLPANTLIVIDEDEATLEKVDHNWELAQEEYEKYKGAGDPVPQPETFFYTREEFFSKIKSRKQLHLNALKLSGDPDAISLNIQSTPPLRGQFETLADQIWKWNENGRRVIAVAPTKGQTRRLQELQGEYELPLDVDQGILSFGFEFPEFNCVYIAEHEIFGRGHKRRVRRKPKSQSFQRGFKDLKPNDYLVHMDYGIGKYLGARELKTDFSGGEFLEILYADQEKLYVPMEGLGLLQKYIGAGEGSPPLSKLGGVAWKKQTGKIKKSLQEMADDLLKLYASRELTEGHAFAPNPVPVQEFADTFEYVETEDQLKAIEEVEEDLEKDKPMDRLICGDVGYGKTEVAMRAAFKVALEKKQVAFLVPTTILAQQHYNTFRERFRNQALNIACLSRFVSAKEQKRILEKLKKGEVDIVVGTHRILSKDVKFADLGLIVIDEEQRFGVKHKEKLKKMRTSVDILTLTATPIPRTLHFSLMGVRDLSVIETPPGDRIAIKTYIRKFDEAVIQEAIQKELDRGGQVYFVHNKVQSIHSVAAMIHKILPKARIGVGHGQLPESQLESVMGRFIQKEIDVLVCTTIVESGLDIPSANTIIINRADQFGLAQLYQLRGRVGRYKHQAYAYLLIPGATSITEEARQRVAAIQELSELGAGFQLAARDMEIRGVGNMLGHKQSGHISSIGFDMYCKLMDETVKELHGEKVEAHLEPEINLMIKGFIPKDYIPDLNQRLEIYRRMQLIDHAQDCDAMDRELQDRYGALPPDVQKLLELVKIKALCRTLRITRMDMRAEGAVFSFDESTLIPPEQLTVILDDRLSFVSEYQMKLKLNKHTWQDDLKMIERYLTRMAEVSHVES